MIAPSPALAAQRIAARAPEDSPSRSPGPAGRRDPLGLGIDAGGTHTRWALADAEGRLVAQGLAPAFSGLQLADAAGQALIDRALAELAAAARAACAQADSPAGGNAGTLPGTIAGPALTDQITGVVAGVTGFDADQSPRLTARIAAACAVAEAAVQAMNDIELLCRAAFEPGRGAVVYAGTGSVAAHLDAAGTLHRAGGRGAVIDDAGGGHWIACTALRQVWRAEDRAPGAWRGSPLARAVFERIGGSGWAETRQWVYGASRGELGSLALAVAAAAPQDPAALAILQAAGAELALLAQALLQRFPNPPLPLALAGRVFELHPAVEASLRAGLPARTPLQPLGEPAHHAAARLAAARRSA